MSEDIEHPGVSSAMRTGYPAGWIRAGTALCSKCDGAVEAGDSEYGVLLEYNGKMLCRACFEEAVEDDLHRDPVAFAQSLLLTVEHF